MKNLKPKIVLDTNIIISSFFGGNPAKILNLFEDELITVIISTDIFSEFKRVLLRQFENCSEVLTILKLFLEKAELVTPKITVSIIEADPSDNKFLECALAGKADFIISGDQKHLLPLKSFQNIPILSPKQFLDLL